MKAFSYRSRQSLHMAFLSGFFWFGWAMTTYWSVYLKGQGFDAGMVGVLNAICSATSLASIPLWGIVADRIRSIKKIESILLIATAFFWSIVPLYAKLFPGASLPFFLAIPMACFFKNPAHTFHENLLVRNATELDIEYGKLRWIGSLLYVPGCLFIFWVTSKAGYASTFWMLGLGMLPAILLTLTSRNPQGKAEAAPDPGTGEDSGNVTETVTAGSGADEDAATETAAPLDASPKKRKQKLDLDVLFRSPVYVIFLVFTLVYYLALNFQSIFIPFFMDEIGVGSGNYSLVTGYAAILEIPFLLLMGRLRAVFGHKTLLRAVPLVHLISCLLFCFAVKGWPGLILAATFMGIGNGLFVGTVYSYCYEIAPDNVKASAQAFFATVSSMGCIIGSFIGGFVMDALGGRSFFLVTGLLFLLSVVFLLLSRKPKANAE